MDISDHWTTLVKKKVETFDFSAMYFKIFDDRVWVRHEMLDLIVLLILYVDITKQMKFFDILTTYYAIISDEDNHPILEQLLFIPQLATKIIAKPKSPTQNFYT